MINNILNFSHYYRSNLKDQKKFNSNKTKIHHHQSKGQFYGEKQLIKIIQSYKSITGIVYGDDQISNKVIELLKKKNTKFIIKWGQGLDSIDLKSANRNKIKVINFPGFFKTEVAELTIGFILNLLRRINIIDENTKKLKWNRIFSHTLKNKVVGIVGFGFIGKEIAKKLKGFDVKILYHDPKVKIKNGKITLDPPLWIIQSDTVKQMYSMPALEKWAKHSHGNFKNTDYADQVHFMHPTKRQYIKFSELYPVNSTLVLAYKRLLDQ